MRDHLTTRTRDGRGVTLRQLKAADAPPVQGACADPETIRWLGNDVINERYSKEHAQAFIERALAGVAAGSHMSWAIADAGTDELLGHISLIGRGGELTDTAALLPRIGADPRGRVVGTPGIRCRTTTRVTTVGRWTTPSPPWT